MYYTLYFSTNKHIIITLLVSCIWGAVPPIPPPLPPPPPTPSQNTIPTTPEKAAYFQHTTDNQKQYI